MANLYQRKMNDHGDSATEDCIGTEFCTVPHTVMATVSCNSNATLNGFYFGEHLSLVFLPVQVDGREEFGL